jgi:hypothetical protein
MAGELGYGLRGEMHEEERERGNWALGFISAARRGFVDAQGWRRASPCAGDHQAAARATARSLEARGG